MNRDSVGIVGSSHPAVRAVFAMLLLLFSLPAFAFNCGPHVLTYVVAKPDGTPAGVRCVKLSYHGAYQGYPQGFPEYSLHWYGEGTSASGPYRQVGSAIQTINLGSSGTVAYIQGNGEAVSGKVGIVPRITDASRAPSQIAIGGALNETWRLTSDVHYSPLPRPRVCGPNLETYEVKAAGGTGPVMGIRCVLSDATRSSFWYGTGSWGGGGSYAHLGSVYPLYGLGPGPMVARPGQASDLCNASAGATCSNFPDRSIIFTPTSDGNGFNVTGAWNEYWHKPQQPQPVGPGRFDICLRRPFLPQCNP